MKITEKWYAISEDGYPPHIAFKTKMQAEGWVDSQLKIDDSIMVITIDEIEVTRDKTGMND